MEDIVEYFRKATDTMGFPPRWRSSSWSEAQGWFYIGSELLIGFAYLVSFAALARYLRRCRSVSSAVLFLFVGLCLLTGAITHSLEALMFWWPAYRLTTIAKASTGLVSLVTVTALLPMIPKLLALRNPVELQREVAQRRRTEMELRQVHAQLEGVIEQRTSELAAKNAEMEQFLNTVSHDLKNPVVTCLGLAGILREDVQAGRIEESIDSVNRIERSVTRMRQLIDDLLHLSRIGRVRFELTEVDILEIVRSIADELRPRLEQIGAVLEFEDNLPHVIADAQWMRELLENLVTNAMKYGCDNPRPQIVVGSIELNDETRLFVRDNGRGIDSAHHAQIFEPFRRLRSDKEGSGMGLAIVVKIVKMHGGRVWVESEPGRGATFWIGLPLSGATETKERLETAHALT